MAIQYREKYDSWRVYWKNPYTGRQQSQTVKTEAEAKKLNALIAFQLEFEKERFLPDATAEQKREDNSLEATFYLFLKERQFGKKGLEFQLDGMKRPLMEIGRKAVTAITSQDLSMVLQNEISSGVSAKTVHSRVGVLYALLRWAYKRGILDVLPRFPERPAFRSEKLVPPTEQELVRLLEASPPHLQRVILIGAKLGLRVGPCELLGLRWSDIDLDRGIVTVRAAKKNPSEPFREVPIMSALLPVFRAWKQADEEQGQERVIHFHGKPVSHIHTAWVTALKKAGISRRIRPYDLRHAFATDAIAGGADIGTVAKLMGHASVQMVCKHYQHVATKQKRQAVESLPRVDAEALQYAAPGMPQKLLSPLQ